MMESTWQGVLAPFGVDPERPLVTQVSRFDPWKDPLGVIDAFRLIRREVPDAQLALVGSLAHDDPEGIRYLDLTTEHAAGEPDIHLLTNLSGVGDSAVNAFQRASNVIVQKSLREGFGLVVAEGMWKWKPVVGGDVGGHPPADPGRRDRLSRERHRGVRRTRHRAPAGSRAVQGDRRGGTGARPSTLPCASARSRTPQADLADYRMSPPLVVASNRGPLTFERAKGGGLQARRGSGGLVTALSSALIEAEGVWVAAAMSDGDREMVAASKGGRIDHAEGDIRYRLRYLDIPPELYDGYYNRISNGMLWFAYHYLWDTVTSPSWGPDVEEAWDEYVDVNRRFATALAEEGEALGSDTAFLIQDYHLSLVPRMLRELVPDALIAHFSHTSIAGPTYFRMLPARIHDQILGGLMGADVLGFHPRRGPRTSCSRPVSSPGLGSTSPARAS